MIRVRTSLANHVHKGLRQNYKTQAKTAYPVHFRVQPGVVQNWKKENLCFTQVRMHGST